MQPLPLRLLSNLKEAAAQNELDKAQKQIDKYSIAMEGAVTGEVHQGLQTMYEQLEERHKTVQSERDSAARKIEAKEAMEARQAQKVEKMAEQIASLKGAPPPHHTHTLMHKFLRIVA